MNLNEPVQVEVVGEVAVKQSARTPFSVWKQAFSNAVSTDLNVDLPAGKMLVIETATIRITLPGGQFVTEVALTSVGPSSTGGHADLSVLHQGTVTSAEGSWTYYVGTHPITLRIDTRTQTLLRARVQRIQFAGLFSSPLGQAIIELKLSGYTENI